MSTPSLKVVVAITSPHAFQSLGKQSIVRLSIAKAVGFISEYPGSAHLAIAGSDSDLAQLEDVICEKIVCDPNSVHDLAGAIEPSTELLMIHDSQRPLTKISQFTRVLDALTPEIDAVRPVSAFIETLKSITADGFIDQTIDRSSMMRISTPQLIRFSAVDFQSHESTWFVALKPDTHVAIVESDPESARINSEKEVELMKALLALQ